MPDFVEDFLMYCTKNRTYYFLNFVGLTFNHSNKYLTFDE